MTGERAPSWQLSGALDGAPPAPADFHERPALVLFFNVECLGCIGRALPFAQTLAERYPGLPVLAVHSVFRPGAPHDLERIRELVAHHGLTFPVLLDDGSATFDAYTAEGTPHWVLIDGEGRVRKSIFGSMDGARQRLDYALLELFGE